jgi:alpha-tubulin suppressor-like RCC1 family protein
MGLERLRTLIRPHLGAASWRLQPARTRRVAILLVLVLIGGISVSGLAVMRWAHAGTIAGDPYTWGTNAFGTLGVGDFNAPSGPTPNHLSSISAGIASVVSGQSANDTLAVGTDGTLWGWGDNNEHEITPDAAFPQYAAPTQVPNISGVTAAAAGNGFTLVLKSDGTVWAWGSDQFGQLGIGTTTAVSATPTQVAFPAGVTIKAIAAGSFHSLAVDTNGNLWGWGFNGAGELGNGLTTNSAVPVQASTPSGVTFTAVAAGQSHSLGLASNGTVYAWGANGSGQLGLGSSTPALTPTAVSGVSGATSIAAGQTFSVVGTSSGVYAFGDDFEGELGNGTSGGVSPAPVPVSGLAGVNVTAVAAGDNHALALGADGIIHAWGYDNDGQLGPNGGANGCGRFGDPCSTSAVVVTGVSGASGIAAGTQFSVATVPAATPAPTPTATPAPTPTATLSCPTGKKLNFRWHYSANGSSGSWSGTKSVTCPGSISEGPQAMEGDLKVTPGTALLAGYDFTAPGNGTPFTGTVVNPQIVFTLACVSGATPSQSTLIISMATTTYTVTGSAWVPSGDQHSPLVYQGSVTVPDVCNGGQVRLNQGGTFSATEQ